MTNDHRSCLLPSFLQKVGLVSTSESTSAPLQGAFVHSDRLGGSEAHCLWWPCKAANAPPSTVLLFVPGNPGLAGFYKPYLSHIHDSAADTLAILGCSLLGHSPDVDVVPKEFCSLLAQVEGVIEVMDALRNSFGLNVKIVLVAHSVGAWIILQALKERSDQVAGAFMLFPAMAHIAKTPNGKRFRWLFYDPMPWIVSYLSRLLHVVPNWVTSALFRDWPTEQFRVLWSFINSPSAVRASMTMAHEEMLTIKELDYSLLENLKYKLYFFFAEKDDWVGANKDSILREMASEPNSVRVIHGKHGIPHAFCINHGKELADQCLEWLHDRAFNPNAEQEFLSQKI